MWLAHRICWFKGRRHTQVDFNPSYEQSKNNRKECLCFFGLDFGTFTLRGEDVLWQPEAKCSKSFTNQDPKTYSTKLLQKEKAYNTAKTSIFSDLFCFAFLTVEQCHIVFCLGSPGHCRIDLNLGISAWPWVNVKNSLLFWKPPKGRRMNPAAFGNLAPHKTPEGFHPNYILNVLAVWRQVVQYWMGLWQCCQNMKKVVRDMTLRGYNYVPGISAEWSRLSRLFVYLAISMQNIFCV